MLHAKKILAAILLLACIAGGAQAMPWDNGLDPAGYDIDHVVDVALSSMTKAARGRTDESGDRAAVRKYSSDARKLLLKDIAFKKELGKVLLEVDKAARDAINPPEFPGTPIISTSAENGVNGGLPPAAAEAKGKTASVNTRPCVSAGLRGIREATLESYPEIEKDQSLIRRYERNFSAVLNANRRFGRLLSDACVSLIELAAKRKAGTLMN